MQKHYFFVLMLTAMVHFLKGMEFNNNSVTFPDKKTGNLVTYRLKTTMESSNINIASPDPKGNYASMADNCVRLACDAYQNGRHDIALDYFKKGKPESSALFEKIENISDVQQKKNARQILCHYLFASSQWAYLKTIPQEDQIYSDYIQKSIVPIFIQILGKNPANDIEKEIIDKTLAITDKESLTWLVGNMYSHDRPDLVFVCFKQVKESSELLEKINSIENEQKRENALKGYCHYWFGKTMISETGSEKEISPECQQDIAKAFRYALATKVDTKEAQAVVRDTLKELNSFTNTRSCLYTGWERMSFHFATGKFKRALKELDACINWDEKDGFGYSFQEMKYCCMSPAYNQIVSLDSTKIFDPLQQAFFLQKVSQLIFINCYIVDNLSSQSLQDPLDKGKKAAEMVSVLLVDPTFPNISAYSMQLNMRWWNITLEAKQKFYQLQENLEKPHTKARTKIKVQKITKYLDEFAMDIKSVAVLVKNILQPNPDITEHVFIRTNKVRAIFAFKKLMDEKSTLEDKEHAIGTFQALAETDIYAQNMFGIICTDPRYRSRLSSSKKLKEYKELGRKALIKVANRVNTLQPRAKTIQEYNGEVIPAYSTDGAFKNYLPFQGNCYIHAELAKMHAAFNTLDKMREHVEAMFETCYLGKKDSQKILTNTMNDIFGILGKVWMTSEETLKDFIQDIEQKALKYNIQIKNLENYKELKVNKIAQNQSTNQNT